MALHCLHLSAMINELSGTDHEQLEVLYMQQQHRRHTRSNISIAAQLTPEGGDLMHVMVKDLSLHGILVHAEQTLEVGQKCQIRILVGHQKHELPINAEGSVVRIQDGHLAIEFGCVGVGATEELESTILTHSSDPEQCLKEFRQSEFIFDPLTAHDFTPPNLR